MWYKGHNKKGILQTDHMINCPSLITTITAVVSSFVKLPNSSVVPVTHIDTIFIGITTLYPPVLSTGWRFTPQCTKIVRWPSRTCQCVAKFTFRLVACLFGWKVGHVHCTWPINAFLLPKIPHSTTWASPPQNPEDSLLSLLPADPSSSSSDHAYQPSSSLDQSAHLRAPTASSSVEALPDALHLLVRPMCLLLTIRKASNTGCSQARIPHVRSTNIFFQKNQT